MDQGGIGYSSGGPFDRPGGNDREEGRCYCGKPLDMVEVHVTPTTGGQFQLKVASSDSVEYLRKLISKRLRVPKERICLLYRERHLREGTLVDNCIMDGARITLLPSVETGLLTQRPEQSVMQALESLNDGQVNDFLSGKAPLNLTMRLGDHMMLIQLQLSTVSPPTSKRSSARASSSSHAHEHHHYLRPGHSSNCPSANHPSCYGLYAQPHSCPSPVPTPLDSTTQTPSSHSQVNAPSPIPQQPNSTPPPHYHRHHYHHHHHNASPGSPPTSPSSSSSGSPLNSPYSADSEPPIRGCPHQDAEPDPTASLDTKALAEASRNLTQTLKQLSNEVLTTKPAEKESVRAAPVPEKRKAPTPEKMAPTITSTGPGPTTGVTVNSCPSASASAAAASARAAKRQGAIIESMHHHGKGVYSGTFSGTLNPALQDRQGRPKRDISTIIHILNDLLCATPQYRRHSVTKLTTGSVSRSSPTKSASHKHSSDYNQFRNVVKTTEGKSPDKQESIEDNSDSSMDDSEVTRTKLEQLRYIMEQRRAMRKARRDARATPYANNSAPGARWSSEATTLVASNTEPTDTEPNKDCDLKPAVVA